MGKTSGRFIRTVSEKIEYLDKTIHVKPGQDLTNGQASMQTHFSKKDEDGRKKGRKERREGGDGAWKIWMKKIF